MGKKGAALVAGFPVFTRHHYQWVLSNDSLDLVPERYMGRPRLHLGRYWAGRQRQLVHAGSTIEPHSLLSMDANSAGPAEGSRVVQPETQVCIGSAQPMVKE